MLTGDLFTAAGAIKATGTPILGYLAMWDTGGIAVAPDALRASMARHGLNENDAPTVTARGALAKAVEAAIRTVGERARYRADLAARDAGAVSYRIIDREARNLADHASGADVRALPEAQVVTFLPGGSPRFGTTDAAVPGGALRFEATMLCDTIRAAFVSHYAMLDGSAVTATLVRVLTRRAAAVPVATGVYYAPFAYASTVDALGRVMLDVGARFAPFPVPHIQATSAGIPSPAVAVAVAATSSIKDDLATLEAELTDYTSAERKRAPKDNALRASLERAKLLREKARLYEETLNVRADETRAALARIESALDALF